MSPIEKARAKSAALQVLGLENHAGQAEIRAAWRKKAFETHPDRNGGALEAFTRAREAYELLLDGGAKPVQETPAKPAREERAVAPDVRVGARPQASARVTQFSPDVLAECRNLFLRRAEKDAALLADGKAEAATDHVPSAVHRQGRNLIYVVESPLRGGVNRVSVPTAVLENKRKINPKILSFHCGTGGAGEIDLPEDMRSRLFPGARSVRVRFAAA